MGAELIDLDPVLETHLSAMLALGLSKHKEAIALVKRGPVNAAHLREIWRLLDDVEVLVSDAASYVNSETLQTALSGLHAQQSALLLALNRAECTTSPSPWPWVTGLIILVSLLV